MRAEDRANAKNREDRRMYLTCTVCFTLLDILSEWCLPLVKKDWVFIRIKEE